MKYNLHGLPKGYEWHEGEVTTETIDGRFYTLVDGKIVEITIKKKSNETTI